MARSAQNKAWESFVEWCRRRGLSAVPANPWTLAAFVRWSEPRQTPRAIAKMIREISRVHESKTRKRLDRDPLVQRTLGMIETRRATKRDKSRVDLFEDAQQAKAGRTRTGKTPAKREPAQAKTRQNTESRAKAGLSATPRLVARRRLKS
jgi:hypothetical protein